MSKAMFLDLRTSYHTAVLLSHRAYNCNGDTLVIVVDQWSVLSSGQIGHWSSWFLLRNIENELPPGYSGT